MEVQQTSINTHADDSLDNEGRHLSNQNLDVGVQSISNNNSPPTKIPISHVRNSSFMAASSVYSYSALSSSMIY